MPTRATPALRPVLPSGSAGGVLAVARAHRAASLAAEAGLLVTAAEWASMHEPVDDADASVWFDHGDPVAIAGPGCPEVTEFAVAEFAAAVGLTTDAGRRLVGQAVELAHRLPRLWAQTVAGRVPAWRARRVAEHTMALPVQGAGFVDAHLAAVAGKVTGAQLERLVAEAERRWAPERAQWPDDPDTKPDTRGVWVDTEHLTMDGVVALRGNLDLADALDLDKALTATAQQLKAAGSSDSLNGRRATALGALARTQLTLGYPDPEDPPQTAGARPAPARRPVTLYLHLSEAAVTGSPGGEVGRCENVRAPVGPATIRAWCRHPDVELTIKPVVDLNDHITVGQYEVGDRLREQIVLRDGHCVFPWCTRPARTAGDCDHTIPHAAGGPTCTCNLAMLCRHHHRVKTHTGWRYTIVEPGVYLWTSPHGYAFLRDHTGTLDVTPTGHVPTPGCPVTVGTAGGAGPPDQ